MFFKSKPKSFGICSIIIVAAGNSTRMGQNKQFMLIKDIPVLALSLMAFESSDMVGEIVVVAREEDIVRVGWLVKEFGIKKVTSIIKGGLTRSQSVRNAIGEIKAFPLTGVHDGARPLINPNDIEAVIEAAKEFKAASLAVRVKDTIKVSDKDGFISKSLNRDSLYAMQTPQIFETDILKRAYDNDLDATDDCMLVERLGIKVKLVLGSYSNIKITTIEDIKMAESFYRY